MYDVEEEEDEEENGLFDEEGIQQTTTTRRWKVMSNIDQTAREKTQSVISGRERENGTINDTEGLDLVAGITKSKEVEREREKI